MNGEKTLIKGICEKVGKPHSFVEWEENDKKEDNEKKKKRQNKTKKIDCYLENHKKAFEVVKNIISNETLRANEKIIKDFREISAIGHRVVHGGKYFSGAALINDEVIEKIKSLTELAPLHNQASLNVILTCCEIFQNSIKQVAVFDTSFYSYMPQKAYMYGLPYEYYEKYDIRKYGFHGTSHKFVSQECAKMIKKDIKDLKIISCHLGSGVSVTAINNGKATDTSMGFTPLDGIIMGTRCGAIDPSVVSFLEEKEGLSPYEVNEILNKKSGLLGISGVSNDDREVLEAIRKGNKRAILAHEIMDYQIIKYIGAYAAAMNGLDVLIFTAGIGENQWEHREKICENLSFLGLKIDKKLNKEKILGSTGEISCKESKIKVFVVGTNEELMIAREVAECLDFSV